MVIDARKRICNEESRNDIDCAKGCIEMSQARDEEIMMHKMFHESAREKRNETRIELIRERKPEKMFRNNRVTLDF